MTYSLTWLPQVLTAAGLHVTEQPGWQTRGHGDVGTIKGVLCHHTAGAKTGNAPSLGIVTNGRPDLSGPLAQLVLGRDAMFYIVAAGSCYHAGAGNWQGVTEGNHSFIGIEAENTGLQNDSPWPDVQVEAYAKGAAAILTHIHAPVIMCAGHKEYALPHGRKSDPDFDMNAFRVRVSKFMPGMTAPFIPVPLPGPMPQVSATRQYRVNGVTPDRLAFRQSPDGDQRGALPENTLVSELSRDGYWMQVKTPAGYIGWVASRFLVAA